MADQPSPFADLDTPEGSRPRGDVGKLARDVQALCGVGGLHCLAAAILIDQGRASAGLDLLGRAVDEIEDQAERKRDRLRKGAA